MSKKMKIREKIDHRMSLMPPLPKGLKDWILKSGFKEKKFIFYKRISKKETIGICSHCGSRVNVAIATHNELGKCPSCKSWITYKAIGKAKRYYSEEVISVIQKVSIGFVIRYIQIRLVYKPNGANIDNFPWIFPETLHTPIYEFWEGSRCFLVEKKNGGYSLEDYEDRPEGWVKERTRSVYFNAILLRNHDTKLYRKNLKNLFRGTELQYCSLDLYQGDYINPSDYFDAYFRRPYQLEMFVKMGFKGLVKDMLNGYFYRNPFEDIEFKSLQTQFQKQIKEITLKHELRSSDVENLKKCYEWRKLITEEQYEFIRAANSFDHLSRISQYTSLQRYMNYIKKQSKWDEQIKISISEAFEEARRLAIEYRDYLADCETLGFDLNDDYFRFPKNLAKRHFDYSLLVTLKSDPSLGEGISKTYEKWKGLNYKSGEFTIAVARNLQMMVYEGRTLKHCVGGTTYTRGMANGSKVILMIRKNGKPYSTVELNPQTFKIVQNYGFRDKKMEDALAFAEVWLKKHVSKVKKTIQKELENEAICQESINEVA